MEPDQKGYDLLIDPSQEVGVTLKSASDMIKQMIEKHTQMNREMGRREFDSCVEVFLGEMMIDEVKPEVVEKVREFINSIYARMGWNK
jgi:hypothetical protein